MFKFELKLIQNLKIIKTIAELQNELQNQSNRKPVGLVPTMGALHNGHLSLIALAKEKAAIVVCSIFVNPTQFTDATDLEKYPRPIDADIEKLEKAQCDILFMPDVQEMYPQKEHWHLDIEIGRAHV